MSDASLTSRFIAPAVDQAASPHRSLYDSLKLGLNELEGVPNSRASRRSPDRERVRATWLVEQTSWKDARYKDIRVLFADEPAGSIAPLPG